MCLPLCVHVSTYSRVCVPTHVTNFVAGKHSGKLSGPVIYGKRLQDHGNSQCVHICIVDVIIHVIITHYCG